MIFKFVITLKYFMTRRRVIKYLRVNIREVIVRSL